MLLVGTNQIIFLSPRRMPFISFLSTVSCKAAAFDDDYHSFIFHKAN